jgi:predicted phosphodiesterase
MSDKPLVFLHLSDIHFSKRSGGAGDLDQDLRRELEADAKLVRKNFDHCTGILVSGDVAFSGQSAEYDTAKAWLGQLCASLGCSAEDVWVVPGNHDVDRGEVRKNRLVQSVRKQLRPAKPSQVELEIAKTVDDASAMEVLHKPFANYNLFAAGYNCQVGSGHLHWQNDLVLNDRSKLRLWGINSALISDDKDDENENRLVIGTLQASPPREEGVTYLAMCHHPLDWIWDRDEVKEALKARVAVTLFGHEHKLNVEMLGSSLWVAAGAVHPSRDESGWLPRYNFLTLLVETRKTNRQLRVGVWSRLWDIPSRRFRPDYKEGGKEMETFHLPLPDWQPPPTTPSGVSCPTTPPGGAPVADARSIAVEGRLMNPERRLAFRFFDLPYTRRMEVVQFLGLISDEDEHLREDERYRRYFIRTKERGLFHQLWREVESRHPDGRPDDNPFPVTN